MTILQALDHRGAILHTASCNGYGFEEMVAMSRDTELLVLGMVEVKMIRNGHESYHAEYTNPNPYWLYQTYEGWKLH